MVLPCIPLIAQRKNIKQSTQYIYMDVSKNRWKTPKMDGENNGKPY